MTICWPMAVSFLRLLPLMFIIRFIRMLLSLPFLWGGQLTGMFQMPISIPLLRAAWWISANGQTGLSALVAIAKHGDAAQAIGCAIAWTEKYPRVELSAYAGILAANAGLEDVARNMLVAAKQLPVDQLGLTELLEFSIAMRFDASPNAACDYARGLEARSDLSPTVSKMMHAELLWNEMLTERLGQAKRRAQYILSVEDDPIANVVMSEFARVDGNALIAAKHLEKATKLPPAELHYYRFLAACGTGSEAEAAQQLAKINKLNSALAERAVWHVNATRGSK